MGERLTFTFALTGRRNGEHGTQGVALGYELAGLSARTEPQIGLFRTISIDLIFQFFNPPTCRVLSPPVIFLFFVNTANQHSHIL